MKPETLQNAQRFTRRDEVKAVAFVTDLVASGVPLGAMYFNAFDDCPAPRVYITKHLGRGGARTYKRFSRHDYESALRWVRA